MKTYHIEFNSFREGIDYSLEKDVVAPDIYDAMNVVESYCSHNYGTCEIRKVEEIKNESEK